jgi:hypothetical protein
MRGNGKLRAALAVVGLMLLAGTAQAAVTSTLVNSDTLACHMADSSAVKDVSNAARMWLDFIIPPGPAYVNYGYSATADTAVVLMVQAREILSGQAGTDSLTAGTAVFSQTNNPALYSDSTVVPWVRSVLGPGTPATDSTATVNITAPSVYGASSSEYRVVIPTRFVAGIHNFRTARLDLVNPTNGAPFRAQFAQFKWRMVAGPKVVKLRVVLGMETF